MWAYFCQNLFRICQDDSFGILMTTINVKFVVSMTDVRVQLSILPRSLKNFKTLFGQFMTTVNGQQTVIFDMYILVFMYICDIGDCI